MLLKGILTNLFIILFATLVAAQQTAPSQLPDTQAGRRVAAYLQAFNSGDDEKIREFFVANVSPAALQQRPLEARLGVYRNMRGRLGAVKLHSIVKTSENSITALFATELGDWVEINFDFETESPHRFLSLRVEDADPPAGAERVPDKSVPAANITEAAALSSIESIVNKAVSDDEFSGTVLVARGGTIVFQKAYGLASREDNVPNRPDTKFNLGSINKTFTQVAIGQLVAQGKLSYDDKLSKILPGYPNREAADKITLRQLLSMTSGIGDIFGPEYEATPKNRLRNIKDFMPLFVSKPLLFEPGTSRRYSNGGYIVLGAIIEKVSGRDYYDYVREHIFKPAGMTDSGWYEKDRLPPNTASGYTREGAQGQRRPNIFTLPARGSSAGGGYSTAEDLLKFTRALQTGKLRMADFGQASRPPAQGEANGLAGGLGIAGGSPGVNGVLEVIPDNEHTVVVLSNYDPPSAEKLSRQIVNLLRQVKK
jgi:CubicO group peptidase (beta-lactamase class C family)